MSIINFHPLKHRLMALFLLLACPFLYAQPALDKVSLQLEWKYQFEFAGFIMAKEKGFYKEAGLDVDLIEYQNGIDTVNDVLAGKHNYGIHNSSIAIENKRLKPIITLATYFQRSPLVLVTSKKIKTPKDLIGKKIMLTNDELKFSTLALLMDHFFINERNSRILKHDFNIKDFVQHKIDAMSAFRTNQLYQLNQLHIPYNIIDPADYGFVMGAGNLFTSSTEALNHPKRTQHFTHASNKGWAYALKHPKETARVIYKKYSQKKTLEALEYEARITRKMMLLGFFDIGSTDKELALRAVKQFKYSGLLLPRQQLGIFSFDELLQKFDQSATFTSQQKRYLQAKKSIRLCVDPQWMPFESIQNGKHIGIAADIFSSFASKLPIPIQLIQTKSWAESLNDMKNHDCDVLSLASATPTRIKYMNFTTPYISLPLVLATTMDKFFISDISEVKTKKLGVVKGYAIAEILRKKYKGIHIVDVDSITDGLQRVESGELFGYIDNLMTIAEQVQKDFTGVLKVSARLDEKVRLSVASRSDQPILNEVFQKLVNHIDKKYQQSIYNKWVSIKQEVAIDYRLLLQVFIFIALLGGGLIIHNLRLRQLNKQLQVLSNTDKLTRLYNRLKMDQSLHEQKEAVSRYDTQTSLILMDIDFFKRVNDTYGHPIGDTVLIEFSDIIKQNIRSTDIAGRWGGEEFLLICPNIGIEEARLLADKLLHKIASHLFIGAGEITASAGISQLSKTINIKDALLHADKALYQAKDAGRNRSEVFNVS